MYYVINVFQTVLVNVEINVHLISRIRGIGNLYFFLDKFATFPISFTHTLTNINNHSLTGV